MSIELTWIEHQKSIAVGLITFDRKVATYYSGLVIEFC